MNINFLESQTMDVIEEKIPYSYYKYNESILSIQIRI